MTIPITPLSGFRIKLNRATALARTWLERHASECNSIIELTFLLWRHARGNTALREAILLRGCLSVARNALQSHHDFRQRRVARRTQTMRI